MNTSQLLKILPFTDVATGGVYAADQVPEVWPRPCAIIANTDDHTQPGTHWVAFYINPRGEGVYFDSFGMPPTNTHFKRLLRRNCRIYRYNNKRLQNISSNFCGHYCIVMLHWLCNDNSLRSFQQLFSTDTERNDNILLVMFRDIVKKNKNKYKKNKKSFTMLSGRGTFKNQRCTSKYVSMI